MFKTTLKRLCDFERIGFGRKNIRELCTAQSVRRVHFAHPSALCGCEIGQNSPELSLFVAGSTDTVCVIGIVNVNIVGSIANGERIYASRHRPGMAIAQSQVPVGSFLRKKHVLLGMALESKKTSKTPDEVHLVKCFVCIVLDVSRQELLEEIEELYEVNETRTDEQIKVHSKKTWRRAY